MRAPSPKSREKGPDRGKALPGVHYASRSKEEEPGKDSTGDQLRELREHFGPPIAEYADHASGYRGNRGPDLEQAMAHAVRLAAEHGQAELRVVKSERFARGSGRKNDARSVMEVYVEMRRAGVALRSVHDDAFLTNPMLVGVADEMAHKYSEDLAAHVRRGINSNVRDGRPWGQPRYGYRRRADSHWEQDPHEAPIARRIFDLYLRLCSYNAVAAALNAEGIRPRRGTRWRENAVSKIINGRAVRGEFEHVHHVEGCRKPANKKRCSCPGEWRPGQHEPIVDEKTWQAAQRVAEQARRYAPRGAGRTPTRHVFMRGMLRCGLCDESMLPQRGRRGNDFYVCAAHAESAAACPMPRLPRDAVDTATLGLFERWALDVDGTRRHVADRLGARASETRAQAERADRDAAQTRRRLARAETDYQDGKLSAETFDPMAVRLREQLAAAEAEHDRLMARSAEVEGLMDGVDAESEALRRLAQLRSEVSRRVGGASDDLGALRAALAQVFEVVYVLPEALYGERVAEDTQHPGFAPDLLAPLDRGLVVVPAVRHEIVADQVSGEPDEFLRRVALALGVRPQTVAPNQHGTWVS